MPDLPATKQDCLTLRVALEAYGIVDRGPDNMYVMDDPNMKRVRAVKRSLMMMLKDNPDKKVLIVFILAGHGMQMSGKQVVLLNEFNADTGFYKFWGIEENIRALSELYPNSY